MQHRRSGQLGGRGSPEAGEGGGRELSFCVCRKVIPPDVLRPRCPSSEADLSADGDGNLSPHRCPTGTVQGSLLVGGGMVRMGAQPRGLEEGALEGWVSD